MRYVFILNPFAGPKDSTGSIKDKIDSLNVDGECFVEYTKGRGDATRIAKKYVSSTDDFVRVYTCGGDGTANEALCGMIGHDNCALGVIPIGSGNDFVRSVKNTQFSDFLDVEKMANGTYQTIDLFECQGHYAMNVISVGYDCAVADQAQKIKRFKGISGAMAYRLSIVYCLFSKRKHNFIPFADNKKVEIPEGHKTWMLAVAGNGKYYGGGMKATPYAEFDDGNIDFMAIPTVAPYRFIGLIGSFVKGEHIGNKKMSFILHSKCKSLLLKSGGPMNIGLDGEIMSMTDPLITVLPSAFKIIVPCAK